MQCGIGLLGTFPKDLVSSGQMAIALELINSFFESLELGDVGSAAIAQLIEQIR